MWSSSWGPFLSVCMCVCDKRERESVCACVCVNSYVSVGVRSQVKNKWPSIWSWTLGRLLKLKTKFFKSCLKIIRNDSERINQICQIRFVLYIKLNDFYCTKIVQLSQSQSLLWHFFTVWHSISVLLPSRHFLIKLFERRNLRC